MPRKVYGFTAILCYSRMRFVMFAKRSDCPTMIRCLMEAFEYFGGLPKAALTDRMKSVLLEMEGNVPRWNARFVDGYQPLSEPRHAFARLTPLKPTI